MRCFSNQNLNIYVFLPAAHIDIVLGVFFSFLSFSMRNWIEKHSLLGPATTITKKTQTQSTAARKCVFKPQNMMGACITSRYYSLNNRHVQRNETKQNKNNNPHTHSNTSRVDIAKQQLIVFYGHNSMTNALMFANERIQSLKGIKHVFSFCALLHFRLLQIAKEWAIERMRTIQVERK